MQEHELTAYLGDFADEVTADQRAAMHRAEEVIETRYPGDDLQSEVAEAFSAAVQVILGDDTLEHFGETWRQARMAERAAMVSLTGAIIAQAQTASEVEVADRAGVDRQTVRKALGKNRRTS